MPGILQQDVKYLKGVGPRRAQILQTEWGVRTVADLLACYPTKYIDRSRIYKINELVEHAPYVQLRGRIMGMEEEGEGYKKRLRATFTDGTGYVELVWFNGLKTVRKSYSPTKEYLLFGKPSVFNGRFSFAHPELEKCSSEMGAPSLGLHPVYRLTEKMKRAGFNSHLMRELMQAALALAANALEETLPEFCVARHGLLSRREAVCAAHLPASAEQAAASVERLKFEELFFLQLAILRYTFNRRRSQHGYVFARIGAHFMDFYEQHLPFRLTEAQMRVLREIRTDVGSGKQMNRLLQGDVGSGKTIVALLTCLMALDNGFQACLMAPTEILAEQHYEGLSQLLRGLPLRVELLTGEVRGARRREILTSLQRGEVNILIGTHALVEPSVVFQNLGLVVIDEQHRFGVEQRARLWTKNVRAPHVLVMTATPIPRTLAMTVYGDLDVSVIDQLPPGRKPIKTLHYYHEHVEKLIDGVACELSLGHQVYVVYPLIEESEKSDLKSLEEGVAWWTKRFPHHRVGKLHGRMPSAEKEAVMRDFVERKTQILVSTTVIEVGVNVPNASVMVIEEAQRFGLAQLHQLRGRVGRGAEQSYCILVTGYRLSEVTRRRLQIMVDTTDGFVVAEEDLKLRGPGDLEGTQQSGLPLELKVASLARDGELMARAREDAAELLRLDPDQAQAAYRPTWSELDRLRSHTINFSAIS